MFHWLGRLGLVTLCVPHPSLLETMSRITQKSAARGSQKKLRACMAKWSGTALSAQVAKTIGVPPSPIQWLSPLPDDDFAEYSDDAFLECLAVALSERPLSEFWSRRGPVC